MQPNLITQQLQNITPGSRLEQDIIQNLLMVPDPQMDDLLSHIECTYYFPGDAATQTPILNPGSKLKYQDGIDFLTKYNLMP